MKIWWLDFAYFNLVNCDMKLAWENGLIEHKLHLCLSDWAKKLVTYWQTGKNQACVEEFHAFKKSSMVGYIVVLGSF